MFLYLTLFIFAISSSMSTVIKAPLTAFYLQDQLFPEDELVSSETLWLEHFKDFTNLIDSEKVLGTVVRFIDDLEAMRFVSFLLSPKFKEIIWEIEDMNEFHEAYVFLREKGYDIRFVIDAINSDLNLPPFKPQSIEWYENGVSGFLAAVMGSLPIEDMKTLFQKKMENNPEFADLYQVVSSSEFKDIMQRMLRNAKFSEFKNIFENYGVDFEFICEVLKEVFNDYNGIFCDNL